MKITRDSGADPSSDWADRIVIVWTEDDVEYEDKERIADAWRRITGRDLAREERLGKQEDRGDWVATLRRYGWVSISGCEGGAIGIVAKVIEGPAACRQEEKR